MKYEISAPGIAVTLCDLGASVTSVRVSGREVALSPQDFDTGPADPSLAGRAVGPCCGRVRNGKIDLNGNVIQLDQNEGPNHLHGGTHGASFQRWRAEDRSPTSVRFALDLPHGLDGYPGNRHLTAKYSVSENTLRAVFSVVTDRPTWAGMTSHLYWDLTGRFDGAAMGQLLEISANKVVMNDGNHMPVSVTDAAGPFDFTVPAAPADKMRHFPDEPQYRIARGFNNAFLLNRERAFAARLTGDGLRMTLHTDQPAIVFYSGGFLGPETRLETGPASPGCALALEAQSVPDPFHLPGQVPEITTPERPWRGEIIWTFEKA